LLYITPIGILTPIAVELGGNMATPIEVEFGYNPLAITWVLKIPVIAFADPVITQSILYVTPIGDANCSGFWWQYVVLATLSLMWTQIGMKFKSPFLKNTTMMRCM
jgi:hypothetical protein